jgi:hypothetical protein
MRFAAVDFRKLKIGHQAASGRYAEAVVIDHGCGPEALSDDAAGAANDTARESAFEARQADARLDFGRPALARRARHRAAVLDAEVELLVDVLSPFGVLSRADLGRRADCRFWPAGTFDGALRSGVERGVIELLPHGFVAVRRRRLLRRRNPSNLAERRDRGSVSDR